MRKLLVVVVVLAMASALAAAGSTVALTGRSGERARAVAAGLPGAVGLELDVRLESIREAIAGYSGVDRRFQVRGQARGVTVIDDYGHHPTEVRATLAAARQCGFRRIHVIFQPHRYTRTQLLLDEFATAFTDADTADSSSKAAPVDAATIRASVVFPLPGGP